MAEIPQKVLYVEDNLDNRMLVQRILQAEGYEFLGADNAAEGLKLARQHHPDLILVDINMPDVDGLSMTRQLKADQVFSKTPVIAITANVMRGDREYVGSRLGRPDVHMAINHRRIHADDLAGKTRDEFDGDVRLAGRGRSDDADDERAILALGISAPDGVSGHGKTAGPVPAA